MLKLPFPTNEMWNDGTTGRRNASLGFDGTNDYAALPDNNPIWLPEEDLTVSAWFYKTTSGVGEIFDGNYGESGAASNRLGFTIRLGSDIAQFAVVYGDGSLMIATSASGSFNLNTWHHVLGVREGGELRVYLDGVEVASDNSGTTDNIDYVGGYDDDNVSIGRFIRSGMSGTYFFPGQIDEVKIFNYALTPLQIKNEYNSGAVRFGP